MSIRDRTEVENTPIHEASQEEGWTILDAQARARLGISGQEFVRKWEAGEYFNGKEQPEVMHVAMLLPFVR